MKLGVTVDLLDVGREEVPAARRRSGPLRRAVADPGLPLRHAIQVRPVHAAGRAVAAARKWLRGSGRPDVEADALGGVRSSAGC